jgi:hypothetical protein
MHCIKKRARVKYKKGKGRSCTFAEFPKRTVHTNTHVIGREDSSATQVWVVTKGGHEEVSCRCWWKEEVERVWSHGLQNTLKYLDLNTWGVLSYPFEVRMLFPFGFIRLMHNPVIPYHVMFAAA